MKSKVSIIVPIYQSEKTIKKCLDSIIGQTYKNVEIILVDDGSKDSCPKICDDYSELDDRVKVIHKENGGVSSARNLGINEAKGEWIIFVDTDDYIEKNMVECMLNEAIKDESELVICGYKKYVNNELQKSVSSNKNISLKSLKELSVEFDMLCLKNLINTPWNKLYKKENIKIKFEEDLDLGEDLIFNINYLKNINKINVIEDCLYNYNAENNEESLSMKYRKDRFKIINKLHIELKEFAINSFGLDYNLNVINRIFINNTFRVLVSAQKNKKLTNKNKREICLEILKNNDIKYVLKKRMKLPNTLKLFKLLLKVGNEGLIMLYIQLYVFLKGV